MLLEFQRHSPLAQKFPSRESVSQFWLHVSAHVWDEAPAEVTLQGLQQPGLLTRSCPLRAMHPAVQKCGGLFAVDRGICQRQNMSWSKARVECFPLSESGKPGLFLHVRVCIEEVWRVDWCAENQVPDSLGDSGDDVLYNAFDRAWLHNAVWPQTPSPAFNSRSHSCMWPQLVLVLIFELCEYPA